MTDPKSTHEPDEAWVETLRETLGRAADADRRLRTAERADDRDAAAHERAMDVAAGLAYAVGDEDE